MLPNILRKWTGLETMWYMEVQNRKVSGEPDAPYDRRKVDGSKDTDFGFDAKNRVP